MKAIKLCLSLLSVTSVLGLGTKYHLNPDKVYGKGPAFEQKVRDEFAERNSHLNGYAELVESNYTQKLDHFNNTETRTWPMRWLIDNSSYDATNGTILFYAGNEGGIYTFYNNSGFMTETLAKEMNATVIFAEHRYYGTSMPFGADSFKKENLRWLNVQQVMEDYVALLDQIKMDIPSLANKATIAFGGSYGGMLAAWMRMKYPHKIQGALASSAPVLWFRGAVDANAYTRVASKVIKSYGEDCYGNYSRGFYDLTNMQYDSTKYQKINDIFNLCKVPTKASDINNLIASISDSLGTMAMVNYPYETNFVNPLPAWPQQAGCKNATTKPTQSGDQDVSMYDFQHIEALQRGANVFYNYTGQMSCLDLDEGTSGGLDDNGWAVQSCNDMPMPQGDDPSQACFTWVNWDEAAFNATCMQNTGMTPRYDWALDYFGGRNVHRDWSGVSNIIFSNGEYDPWHAGGVLDDVLENNHVIYIKKSAHHLDLRLPNAADPVFVTQARAKEMKIIKDIVRDYQYISIGV